MKNKRSEVKIITKNGKQFVQVKAVMRPKDWKGVYFKKKYLGV